MSVHELMTLARKHWKARLPDKYKELQAERILEAPLNGAANMAQPEIEHLMKQGIGARGARSGAAAVHPAAAGVSRGRTGSRTGQKLSVISPQRAQSCPDTVRDYRVLTVKFEFKRLG